MTDHLFSGPPPRLIALDADDTLWHNETLFRLTHDRFNQLLAPWATASQVEHHLAAVEQQNLGVYGYGAKGFTLSMLQTALELAGGAQAAGSAGSAASAPGAAPAPDAAIAPVLAEILAAGRRLMQHPIEPLPGVAEALPRLQALAPLVLITKGDMFHQESKLAASGLGRFFADVAVVSEKTPETYRRVLQRHGVAPAQALMAGNSVRSDVLPALDAGWQAVLVPYPLVWAHEDAAVPLDHPRFAQCSSLLDLAAWLEAGAAGAPAQPA